MFCGNNRFKVIVMRYHVVYILRDTTINFKIIFKHYRLAKKCSIYTNNNINYIWREKCHA
jgi:hypothetical protein